MTATTRIYAACLASYNNGVLHGAWIDCDGKDASELQDEVSAMLRASRFPNVTVEHEGRQVPSAEEFAIHDREGFGRLVGEYTPLDDIATIAEALNGDHARGFRFLVDNNGMSATDAAAKADEVQIFETSNGLDDLFKEYAAELIADTTDLESLPEMIRHNIDYAGIGYDLKCSGELVESEDDDGRFLVTNANDF